MNLLSILAYRRLSVRQEGFRVQKKLLIVEDNRNNLRLFELILKHPAVDLFIARDGPTALEIIARERPDLILLDIQIPGINGLEVARRVRNQFGFHDVVIIAVTAYAMVGDKEKILAAGCDEYISKPVDTRSLPALVFNHLGLGNAVPGSLPANNGSFS